MSEVVPLPSFGEVFFDARGQDRVLRVTWHDGTLVLSLWRGEMCTASFRMPMNDVGRLIDTLDEGFAEAGGEEQDAGTGPFPRQGAAGQDGYAPQEAYPPHPQDPGQDAYATQIHDLYATQVHDPYAAESPDAYAARAQDAYAVPDAYAGQPGDGYAAQDPYSAPRNASQVPYGQARDGYPADEGHATAPDGYGQAPDEYGRAHDGYAQDESGYAARDHRGPHDAGFPEQSAPSGYNYADYPGPDYPGTGQYARPPVPPPAPAPEAYPAPAALGPNDVLVARGTPTQDRLVASSAQTGPQPAYPQAPRSQAPQPAAAQPAGQPPGAVDPSDPLGLGVARPYVDEQYANEQYANEQYASEPYASETLYTTGERLRPDQWPGGQAPDQQAEHERSRRRRGGQPSADSPIPWSDEDGEGWDTSRGW
ncbi:hypothetical protein ACGFIJ_02575 [Microbispora bryophytorum]|uniref:hypothetical protein n=1 Tax=Microbispora bryophytorum TaxID=1460882 RepID=UPI0037124445